MTFQGLKSPFFFSFRFRSATIPGIIVMYAICIGETPWETTPFRQRFWP